MTDPLIGATTAVFAIALSVALSEPVDVAWATKDGTGKAGVDYEAGSGIVTFLPGETAKQIQVTVYGRDQATGTADRTFYIVLTPPTNAILGDALSECTISVTNDEGTPITSVIVAQGKRGLKGDPGLSAYEQAVLMGEFSGTPEQWMDEIANAAAAAARSQDSANAAAAKVEQVNTIGNQKIAEVTTVGDAKIAILSEIASTSSALHEGQEIFETEAELLAFTPTVASQAAKALDTKKIWLWKKPDANPGTWKDTGLSEYDLARLYANKVTQQAINDNFPDYASDKALLIFTAGDQVIMHMTPDGVLNVEEIQTNSFRKETGTEVLQAYTDVNGLVVFALLSDGTVYFAKSAEEKYRKRYEYRQFLELDKLKNANVAPYFFEQVVADYGTDGKLHQRMPASIRVAPNKLFVAFTQFNTANTDASNGRLVGRFVTFDLAAKTISVDPNTIVMYDSLNTAIASRHPNLIQLKDGRYMCLFNSTIPAASGKSPLYAIYSNDCVTWSAPVLKLADNNDTLTFTISATIQRIHTGKYKDRLIVPVYNTSFEACIMYSDDEGETWKVGQKWSGADFGDSSLQLNETSVAIDIDGTLIAHSRTDKNAPDNRYFYIVKSADGGKSIDIIGKNTAFPVANCAIGFTQAAQSFNDGVPKILASRPTSTAQFVRNMFMISASYDAVQSAQFNYKPYADDVNVGYTHLLALDDQNFVLAMEKGTSINNGNNFISIAFFNMSEIMKNG